MSLQTVIELGKKQAAMCNDNSVVYINCLVTSMTMRHLMTTVYNALVYSNLVIKIELLPLEEKQSLWEQTKEFAKDTLSLTETIRLSKSLYAIEYLMQ